MKVVAISDLHGQLPKDLPEGDVLCICGDIVPLEYQRDLVSSISWFVRVFDVWANNLSYSHVIFIGGNHDFFLEAIHKGNRSATDVMKRLFPGYLKSQTKLIYLYNNSVVIDGKKFYGMPFIEDLSNWAFYATEDDMKKYCNMISKSCDVLMTHMPPSINGLGEVIQSGHFNTGTNYGSRILSDAILERDIKYAICGHVHSGMHLPTQLENGTTAANVSLLNEDYKMQYYPLEFEI